MRSYFLLLLFTLSFGSLAAGFPDSVVVLGGKSYSCYVQTLDERWISFEYLHGQTFSGFLSTVTMVVIDSIGQVYSRGEGLTISNDALKKFLDNRNAQKMAALVKPKPVPPPLPDTGKTAVTEESKKISLDDVKNAVHEIKNAAGEVFKPGRWAFSLLYFPNSSQRFEGEFQYNAWPSLYILGVIGYSVDKDNYDSESRTNQNGTNFTPLISSDLDDKRYLNLDVGVRFTLRHSADLNAGASVFLTLGRQFAFINMRYDRSDNVSDYTSNYNEYYESINSIYRVKAGFGAHHYFNPAIALTAGVRFIYTTGSGTWESKEVRPGYSRTEIRKASNHSFDTEYYIGLTFYYN